MLEKVLLLEGRRRVFFWTSFISSAISLIHSSERSLNMLLIEVTVKSRPTKMRLFSNSGSGRGVVVGRILTGDSEFLLNLVQFLCNLIDSFV